jgi:hypothetical protein
MVSVVEDERNTLEQLRALAKILDVPVPDEDLAWLVDVWRAQANHLKRLTAVDPGYTDPAVIFEAAWDD